MAREKFGKNQFGEIKFSENIKILIIVVELKNVWQIKFGDMVKLAKFTKLFSCQTFVLYIIIDFPIRCMEKTCPTKFAQSYTEIDLHNCSPFKVHINVITTVYTRIKSTMFVSVYLIKQGYLCKQRSLSKKILNQAHAAKSFRPRTLVYVCVCVCVCVCVSAPEAINNQWRDIDRVQLVKQVLQLFPTFIYFIRHLWSIKWMGVAILTQHVVNPCQRKLR